MKHARSTSPPVYENRSEREVKSSAARPAETWAQRPKAKLRPSAPYSKFSTLSRCHSLGRPDSKSNDISTEKTTRVTPAYLVTLMKCGGLLSWGSCSGARHGLAKPDAANST